MISLNELRIGNLLLSNDEVCIVTGLYNGNIEVQPWLRNNSSKINSEQLSYISIDEQWMTRFCEDGRNELILSALERKTDSSDIIVVSTIECYLHDEGFLRVCAYEYEKQPDGSIDNPGDVITLGYRHMKYVHQLQNLYLDLSGKELRVREE